MSEVRRKFILNAIARLTDRYVRLFGLGDNEGTRVALEGAVAKGLANHEIARWNGTGMGRPEVREGERVEDDPIRMFAYTVGNPVSYEPSLDGGEVLKGVGGAVFRTRGDAEAVLEDGYLPRSWFPDFSRKPGRVYGLELPGPIDEVTRPGSEADLGARLLMVPAKLVRLSKRAA